MPVAALLATFAGMAWAQSTNSENIELVGTVGFPTAGGGGGKDSPDGRGHRKPNLKSARFGAAMILGAPVLGNPDPAPRDITKAGHDFFGFPGLTQFDTRNASNGNQFSVEPPDQGLAAGNGFVFEVVNDVLAVYTTNGLRLTPPVAINAFLGLPPEIIRGTPNVFGPQPSDPRAYFDHQLQRWFVSAYVQDVDSSTGAALRSHVYLAVSTTANPLGNYRIYRIDTTDDGKHGTPKNPGCPCFPDQPLIGADAYGFYVSANEFTDDFTGFNGSQIYATSKQGLADGHPGPVVHFFNLPLAEGIAYAVQPALSLGFAGEPASGVEYFLSALDFTNTLDNRIALWAMLNTSSLASPHPNVKLVNTILRSEVYGLPPAASQPAGPTPLGTSLGEGLEQIDSGDDRMQEAVFENGRIWAGLTTVVGGGSGPHATPMRAGIAYFVVRPTVVGQNVVGLVERQGYVAAEGNDSVMYPSIGVTQDGDAAAMALSVVGKAPKNYPSMGFVDLGDDGGDIQVGGAGTGPEDGFSGYVAFQGAGVARWGDYSWAVADTDGSIWMAAEWIPNSPRTQLANWGTFIGRVK
jgi:hypothetical protein